MAADITSEAKFFNSAYYKLASVTALAFALLCAQAIAIEQRNKRQEKSKVK